jgi:hypothetical protein
MYAAPVHHTFSVEQLEVAGDEDSVFFESLITNLLTIISVRNKTVDTLLLEHFGQLR